MIVDLFAGPGGWDEGARQLGLPTVGVEYDRAACLTAQAAGHQRVQADVAQLPTSPMRGRVRGLIASPPCQTFSKAGGGAGREAMDDLRLGVEAVWKGAAPADVCPPDLDPRSVLVLEPVRYARDLRPEWIALEQVPEVLQLWQTLAVLLRESGYSAWAGVLNAADYGVPQTRRRAFLLASRVRHATPPPPTHCQGGSGPDLFGDQLLPWRSMADALGWGMTDRAYPTVAGGKADAGGTDALVIGGSGGREAVLREQREGRWLRMGSQDKPTVRAMHQPAATVLFGNDSLGCVWTDDPGKGPKDEGAVRITVAEAGVLQSFPADYPWQGRVTRQFQQVGNAVPVRLAAHVVSAIAGVPFVSQ